MANNKNDKTLKKNWVEGDTFAIKIDRPKSKYNGRYLILIKHVYGFESSRNDVMFRVKLTKGQKIPSTKEEIEKLEYIKTSTMPNEYRFFPIQIGKTLKEVLDEDKKNKYPIDEFGYINLYKANIYFKPGIKYDEFKFIGNFDITPPEDEYIAEYPAYGYGLTPDYRGDIYIDALIRNYESFNLRKAPIYREGEYQKVHKQSQDLIASSYKFLELQSLITDENEDDEIDNDEQYNYKSLSESKPRSKNLRIDKTLRRTWVEGDTFAVKIDCPKSKYNGRYLILIYHLYVKNLPMDSETFRVKITKDKKIPTTKEEIEKLEYIKTNVMPYEARLLPRIVGYTLDQAIEEDKENTYYLDEFGYLSSYRLLLFVGKKRRITQFEYIGNFDITPPKDEWFDNSLSGYSNLERNNVEYINYIDDLVRYYEDYNLRKSKIYTEKVSKKFHELYDETVKSAYGEYQDFDWE